MYVVSVAPIRKGIPIDELSYFSKHPVQAGALVSVPIRGKITPALVIHSIPAEEAKSELKRSSFALKKLEKVEASAFFSQEFIEAARETASYFIMTKGAAIQALFPNVLLSAPHASLPPPPIERTQKHPGRFIFQAEEVDRYATYKSHVREVFARGRSCFVVLPSIQEIEHAYTTLEKGIQNYTFILHSGLSKKEIIKRWTEIKELKHPVLIIGTPLFIGAPRNDIDLIILDQESSGAYKQQSRPFIDMRYFIERFAEKIGAEFILGDLFLRVETLYRKETGEFEPLMHPKSRINSDAISEIIDMRKSGEQPATGKVAIASRELVDLIEHTRKKGTHCFILGIRKGFAPMTVCGDCGTVVICHECSAPLVLHRKKAPVESSSSKSANVSDDSPNIFLCHRCGKGYTTEVHCNHCNGWRLIPLGIGLAQAKETIENRFPEAKIFYIDRDIVKKHSDAKKIIAEFYQTPGAILIGTEMAIPYLTEQIATVAVLSVNSLLTIPDFRMGERVFRLLLRLREKAREHFLIQSRDPDSRLFDLASSGNIGEFLREELAVRKKFSYPPFSTLIKMTYEGGKADGEAIMSDIERTFSIYHPVSFPGFISRVKGKYLMHALIKVPEGGWPNSELHSLLSSLPPEVVVRVNTDSVI